MPARVTQFSELTCRQGKHRVLACDISRYPLTLTLFTGGRISCNGGCGPHRAGANLANKIFICLLINAQLIFHCIEEQRHQDVLRRSLLLNPALPDPAANVAGFIQDLVRPLIAGSLLVWKDPDSASFVHVRFLKAKKSSFLSNTRVCADAGFS